jgi:drug/metabolite transporter (DMT)-like permease
MTAPRKTELDTLAIALLVGCCAIWGLGQVAAKIGLTSLPPLLQASLRSLIAAGLLLVWSRLRGLRLFESDGTGRAGLLAGSLFAIEFGCIFLGLQFTTASRMAVFIYLAPFVVAAGMPLISPSERLAPSQLVGLATAFAGVVWAYAEGFAAPSAGPRQWLGDALGIAGAALWGLTTLTLRGSRLSTALPEKTLLYQLGLSGVALGVASWLVGEPWPVHLGAPAAAALAFQGVVVTFASYLVWFWLVRHYPATRISAFTLLTPIFGLLAGFALLGDPLTPRLLAALVAVCVGIALVSRAPTRRSG